MNSFIDAGVLKHFFLRKRKDLLRESLVFLPKNAELELSEEMFVINA